MTISKTMNPRRRHSEADREKIISEYMQSDLSQARFASGKGISLSTLQNWIRKSRESKAGSKPGDLVPVRLLPSDRSTEPAAKVFLEIELITGSVIRMSSGFDPDEIRMLVKILRESC